MKAHEHSILDPACSHVRRNTDKSLAHGSARAHNLDSPRIRNLILSVIIFNAIILVMETSNLLMDRLGGVILFPGKMCLTIVVLEFFLKLFEYRLSLFRLGWNLLDFVIVRVSLVANGQGCSALRALRVLWVASVVPGLRHVVEGFATMFWHNSQRWRCF